MTQNQDLRCAVPHLPASLCPLTRTDDAMLVSDAVWQSLRATSRCWPLPVLARAIRLAMIELQAYSPFVLSVIPSPSLTVGPSRSPVICMSPISASAMTSYPALKEYGPVWPYPV